ncbi:NAD kinase-like isoform X1 [Malaya genurostris]|uniref:NAD kinase-like isoform X1 n=2 Tax=Malaya genurostris TaxID=325434 RepID=UPI0026F3AA00|nr:NAD kinase-like isoform X1 [Malaya genurostris]XP_058466886.1 NAD kinase-like isoform X1 [Malaya genurostris]XP_058466887.1 NAD kinase-like isoform X1 [Malaya genurostris]XP_058466888.1 NAD kinase-like isoform X1 [Malaya genurostris]
MAYLSDVDLATLHRSRLEERVHYKLSSWHRSATVDVSKASAQSKPTRIASTNSVGTSSLSSSSGTMDDIINNNKLEPVYLAGTRTEQHQQQRISVGTCNVNTSVLLDEARKVTSNRRNATGWHQSNVHVIKRRSRNSNSCSSTGTSASSNGTAGNSYKHVEWSDEDYLNDDGYFSSETRRRRSGTWPRTRSLNAPSPFQQFGPCGRIMKNSAMVMQIQDPASQRLTWYKPPLAVLVIKKVRDSKVLQPFVELVEWLIQEKHMVVWVEGAILDDPLLTGDKRFTKIQDKLITFKDGRDDLTDKIDFIICLGGDGTLLYASLLFQKSVPPVMAFHLGSLGFLTPFQFNNFQEQVTNVLEGHAALTLRSRLRCIIVRKDKTEQEIATFRSSQDPTTNILVLNEVVIDRGLSSYLSNIDLFLDGKHITSVQGDGLIVSTPTGSTAYSAAAGASMIHPSVPAILVTPICPHSLSFRPIVLPAGVELKIALSPDSRNSSWVSFDGRNRQELLHGDSLHVTTSIYPVPSICAQDQIADWFDSLAECLHWNVRKRQKCLDELSDLTGSGTEDSAIEEIDRGMENLES